MIPQYGIKIRPREFTGIDDKQFDMDDLEYSWRLFGNALYQQGWGERRWLQPTRGEEVKCEFWANLGLKFSKVSAWWNFCTDVGSSMTPNLQMLTFGWFKVAILGLWFMTTLWYIIVKCFHLLSCFLHITPKYQFRKVCASEVALADVSAPPHNASLPITLRCYHSIAQSTTVLRFCIWHYFCWVIWTCGNV